MYMLSWTTAKISLILTERRVCGGLIVAGDRITFFMKNEKFGNKGLPLFRRKC